MTLFSHVTLRVTDTLNILFSLFEFISKEGKIKIFLHRLYLMREKTTVKRCWKIGTARSLLLQPSTILSKSLEKKDLPRDHYTHSHLLICFIQFFLCIIELSLQLVQLFKRILFQLDPKSFLLSFQILNFSVKNLKGVRN